MKDINRRSFSKLLSSFSLAALTLPIPEGLLGRYNRTTEISGLNAEYFIDFIDDYFKIISQDGKMQNIKLKEISTFQSFIPYAGARLPFSLHWEVRGTTDFASGIYQIEHKSAGSMNIYLDVKGTKEDILILESCWN